MLSIPQSIIITYTFMTVIDWFVIINDFTGMLLNFCNCVESLIVMIELSLSLLQVFMCIIISFIPIFLMLFKIGFHPQHNSYIKNYLIKTRIDQLKSMAKKLHLKVSGIKYVFVFYFYFLLFFFVFPSFTKT